jgi:hypothetical protein
MSDMPETVDPELAGVVAAIEQDYIARYGTDARAEQLARRAYAYLDIRQFQPLWSAALRAHAAKQPRGSP